MTVFHVFPIPIKASKIRVKFHLGFPLQGLCMSLYPTHRKDSSDTWGSLSVPSARPVPAKARPRARERVEVHRSFIQYLKVLSQAKKLLDKYSLSSNLDKYTLRTTRKMLL